MFEGLKVAVVIPAFREETRVAGVLCGLPPWVDQVVVVDDASPDGTSEAVRSVGDSRVMLIRHEKNQGVGGATITGFKKALELGADILVKMDGDGQMDVKRLGELVSPIAAGACEYAKGNRFHSGRLLRGMPWIRLAGNAALSFLVKMASGYWHVLDPQNGYVAISAETAQDLDLDRLDRSYFFEDDMLIGLNILGARVLDVPMPAVYLGNHSSLKPHRILFSYPPRLVVGFFRRVWFRYVIYDFSPVALLLGAGLSLVVFGFLWGVFHWMHALRTGLSTPIGTVMLAVLPLMLGTQCLLSAFQLDIQNSPRPGAVTGQGLRERLARRTPNE